MGKKIFASAMGAVAVCLLAGCGGGGGGGGNGTVSVLTRGIAGAFTATRSRAVNDTLNVNYVLDSGGTAISGTLRATPVNGTVGSAGDFSGGVWNSVTKHIAFNATVNGAAYSYDGSLNDTDTSQEVSTTGTLIYTPSGGGAAVTESGLQFRKFASATPNITGSWTGTFTAPTSNGGNGTLTAAFTQGANSGVMTGSSVMTSANATTVGSISASGAISGSLVGDRFDASFTTTTLGVIHLTATGVTATQISGTFSVPQSASVATAFGGTFLLTKQ